MHDTRQGGEALAPFTGRALALRLALAALPFWLTVPVLVSNVDGPIKMVFAIVLGVTLASPRAGLLLVATTAPLGELIGQLIGARTFRISEAIVLTFLTGWLLRPLRDRRGPAVAAPAVAWLLAALIAASIAGLAWQLGRWPGELAATIDQIRYIYFFVADRIGVVEGVRLLAGIGLVAATVILFRRHPGLATELPTALALSGAAAALSGVLLSRGIGPAEALARYRLIGYRVSGHVGDVNAAGSYFAAIVCLALGMALRERGSRRAIWAALSAASGIGLWLSASRSALGAAGAVIVVAGAWAATGRYGSRARAMALAGVIIALLGGAAIRARLLQNDPDYRGVGFREQFNATSARMIAARPLFGVGVGQYYSVSYLYLSPQLAWSYGFENAHNYFLQIAAELGVAGFALFAGWLAAAFVRTGRALARAPGDARLLGLAAGAAAFLITCATGHPFLVSAAAYPFWMTFGLMTALAGSTRLNLGEPDASRAWPLTAAAALAILVLAPALIANGAGVPPESPAVNGFYGWETLDNGTRFRWTGEYASVFVPADVTRVSMPVRLPAHGGTARPMGIEVTAGGVGRGRTMVDDTWAVVEVGLPGAVAPARWQRIDLKVDRTWQPAVYLAGSADLRPVGVQVGEAQLFRR